MAMKPEIAVILPLQSWDVHNQIQKSHMILMNACDYC